MAEITDVTLTLTITEAKAVHKALGRMKGSDYGRAELTNAGGDVYDELTSFVEEDE